MQYRPDILISDRSGAAVAVIEVKAIGSASIQTATRYLRNVLAHGSAPQADYVLLSTPDTGYLWSGLEAALHESPPSLTFPMARIMHHYLPATDRLTPVRDLVLEAVVEQWLSDLTDGNAVDDRVTSSLREIGFLGAVWGALVNAHAPA